MTCSGVWCQAIIGPARVIWPFQEARRLSNGKLNHDAELLTEALILRHRKRNRRFDLTRHFGRQQDILEQIGRRSREGQVTEATPEVPS